MTLLRTRSVAQKQGFAYDQSVTDKFDADIDAPLTDSRLDQLARGRYAQRVADMIAARRGEHSAVFAIYGEWGSGKTSFKNFVLEKLRTLDDRRRRPLIVEFNPWEWEGPRQVAEAFFARLVEELGTRTTESKEVAERLGRYAAYFTLGASIADSAATILPLFVPGVGPLATLLGKGLKEAGKQTRAGAEAKPKQETLSQLRQHLIESIKGLDSTILVTIDDVDRLTTSETAVLFQLLKSNADFPNVVYLILCDRDVVARNLRNVVAERGDQYLDKIVQLGLPLPKVYPNQIREFVLEGIKKIVSDAGVEPDFNRDRLSTIYDLHASAYFKTMRDVKRFLVTFATLLPAFIHEGEPEVDLVDFLGLELLREFDYPFYQRIYRNRARLARHQVVLSKDRDAFVKEMAGDAVDTSPSMGIFRELFPQFGSGNSANVTTRSIEHPRGFDRFFLFEMPPDQHSTTAERDLLARRGEDDFVLELEAAREAGRLHDLLGILGGAEPPATVERTIGYLAALATFSDTLRIDSGAEKAAYRGTIEGIVFSCLRPLDRSVRTEVMTAACERSNALWFTVSLSSFFNSREPSMLLPSGNERLRELALERLSSAGDQLECHPALGELLTWWADNGGAEKAADVARRMLDDDNQLLALLRAFSQAALSNYGISRKSRAGFKAFTRELNRLVPMSSVLRRLDELHVDSWEDKELVRAVREDARRVEQTDAHASDVEGDPQRTDSTDD